ncbi:MAG: efflux transporter outer membrane subunit [Pseudomonadota bacterium]
MSTLFLSACSVWQDYARPSVAIPAIYKESAQYEGWKTAEPGQPDITQDWWQLYGDNTLDNLIAEANQANNSIHIAEANYRQAQALAKGARAPILPAVDGGGAITRSQVGRASARTDNNIGISANWEIDLWGRIKRSIEAGEANANASAADLESVRLLVQANIAQNYFQLRILDSQKKLLDNTAESFDRSLKLTINRYNVGLASRTEIAQAEAQLRTTRAQSIDITAARSQLEHAIAVLLGRAPADFALPSSPFDNMTSIKLPAIPASLPSSLLERRPDIAASERRIAEANAQIGIARAALFPTLNLGASVAFESSSIAHLLTLPNRIWALGPVLAGPIFDNQLRKSQTEAAIANYDASVSNYKQAVLSGFQEVEDNLALLRILEAESKEQETAVRFAREAVEQTENRYRAGISEYQNVVIVQSTALNAERNALSIIGRRLDASVGLMTALGGKF